MFFFFFDMRDCSTPFHFFLAVCPCINVLVEGRLYLTCESCQHNVNKHVPYVFLLGGKEKGAGPPPFSQ